MSSITLSNSPHNLPRHGAGLRKESSGSTGGSEGDGAPLNPPSVTPRHDSLLPATPTPSSGPSGLIRPRLTAARSASFKSSFTPTNSTIPEGLMNSAFILNEKSDVGSPSSPLLSRHSSFAMSPPRSQESDRSRPASFNNARFSRESFTDRDSPFDTAGSSSDPTSPESNSAYTRRLENENALLCEELQATVAELAEARDVTKQLSVQRDLGQTRLQSILHCIYEQNTILDQCCGQMDFLRDLVGASSTPDSESSQPIGQRTGSKDQSGARASSLDRGDSSLACSTDDEADCEKTPEEVSASCVRKLNRLEVLLKHKLSSDKALRTDISETKAALSSAHSENEMLKLQLDALTSVNQVGGKDSKEVVNAVLLQFEDFIKAKDGEIIKLRSDLLRAHKTNQLDEQHTKRLRPAEAGTDRGVGGGGGGTEERLVRVMEEKHGVELARDDLQRRIITQHAQLSTQIDTLSHQLAKSEQEKRDIVAQLTAERTEIKNARECSEGQLRDMAIALVAIQDLKDEQDEVVKKLQKQVDELRHLGKVESISVEELRTQNESLRRSLDSEREAHRLEIEQLKRQLDELSQKMNSMKILSESNTNGAVEKPEKLSEAKMPKPKSPNPTPKPSNQAKVMMKADTIDVASLESNSKDDSTDAGGGSTIDVKSLVKSWSAKSSGQEKTRKEKESPVSEKAQPQVLTRRKSATLSPSEAGVGGSGSVLSRWKKANTREDEDTDDDPASTPVSSRPHRTRSNTAVFDSSRNYRSPLNKLKIDDIVVQRGRGGTERFSTIVGPGTTCPLTFAPAPSATTATTITSEISSSTSVSASPELFSASKTRVSESQGSVNVGVPLATSGANSGETSDALKELMHKGSHVSVRNALLDWCGQVTKEYPGVEVTNFSSSWNDGLAFCALLYSAQPTCPKPKFAALRRSAKEENFKLAKELAKSLSINFDLDVAKVISSERPDWKVILPVVRAIFEGIASRKTE